jgi:hypothetical protein
VVEQAIRFYTLEERTSCGAINAQRFGLVRSYHLITGYLHFDRRRTAYRDKPQNEMARTAHRRWACSAWPVIVATQRFPAGQRKPTCDGQVAKEARHKRNA